MGMDGCYGECLVKKRSTMKDAALKGIMIGGCTILVILGFLITPWLLVLAALVSYIIYLVWPRFDVVYEYVFVDGQLDFDKILGGNGRKHAKRIDLEKVEIVAPLGSHALDGYRHLNLRPIDFTSLEQGDDRKVFCIMHKGEQGIEEIRFEPSAEMLTLMRKKAPRKIVEM